MKKIILAWTGIGIFIPLMLMFIEPYVEGTHFYKFQMIIWPSSLLGMALQDNGSPWDDQIRSEAIVINIILYAVIGCFFALISRIRLDRIGRNG